MTSPSRLYTSTDLQDFDLEDLVHLEQTFYSIGYEDGHKHGRLHGLIDGRALGAEKGFELWEELGFYEGTARLWTAIASTDAGGGTDARGAHHASALLTLIDRFPHKNPRPDEEEGIDMSAQLRLIRSRYKAMCASLGVRPRLQPAGAGAPPSSPPGAVVADGPGTTIEEGLTPDAAEGSTEKRGQRTVWPLAGPPASTSPQGLSF